MSGVAEIQTHLRKTPLSVLLFPILFVGMTGNSITFLRSFCTINTRWLFLGFIFLYFLFKRQFFHYIDKQLFFVISLYLIWCVFTSFWSEIPELSFLKSGIEVIVVFTSLRVGIEWIKMCGWMKALDYLFFLGLFVLLAGLLGASSFSTSFEVGKSQYHGLVVGSENTFGVLMVMIFPFLLWNTYQQTENIKRFLWLTASICCSYFILLSFCRSAMLALVILLAFFVISLNVSRKIVLAVFIFLTIFAFFMLNPAKLLSINDQATSLLYKQSRSNILYSRMSIWGKSYEAAEEGGLFGVGFGVSAGASEFSLNNLSANEYGREKGNSQLAVIEEAGILGFIFYISIIGTLLFRNIKLFFVAKSESQKVLIAIILGTSLGMIAISCFEAWWTSPGSVESIYFWTLMGIMRGIEIVFSDEHSR